MKMLSKEDLKNLKIGDYIVGVINCRKVNLYIVGKSLTKKGYIKLRYEGVIKMGKCIKSFINSMTINGSFNKEGVRRVYCSGFKSERRYYEGEKGV